MNNPQGMVLSPFGIITAVFIIFMLLTGCAAKTQFVLLPDPDGRVGKIEVATAAGAQVIDKPWQSTEVVSPDKVPGKPKILDEKQVRQVFQEAMEIQPAPPIIFIVHFHRNSFKLSDEFYRRLPEILEAIKSRQSSNIGVTGHTDLVGTPDYNRGLSLLRAKSVAQALVSHGINREFIEIEYYGKEKPLIATPEGVAEPRNRRVEIVVR
jgi:outer membrane protein OmpA-like peptidoglycan-associated protein